MFKDVPATLPIAPHGIMVLLGKTNTGPSGKCPYCHTFIWLLFPLKVEKKFVEIA